MITPHGYTYAGVTIPDHTASAMEAYVNHGQPLGGFLTEVFSNQLLGSFARADKDNTYAMVAIAAWVYNEAPVVCWGSRKTVDRWIAQGGLEGM